MANAWNGMTSDNIAQEGISTLEKMLVSMSSFSTDLSTDIQGQGTTVSTRIVPAATAATDLVDTESGSYAAVTDDQSTTAVQVSLDPHPVTGFHLTDSQAQEIAAGVWSDTTRRLVRSHVRGIAEDILGSLFALVTNSNYSTAGLISTAANFDADDVADLRVVCDDAGWPSDEGTMVLNSSMYGALVKDNAIQDYSASQSDALRTGTLPNLSGFTVIKASTLPSNSENLAGFVALPDAMAIAMRGVDTQDRSQFLSYQVLQDDSVGAVMTYSAIWTPTYRRVEHVFEALYGVAKAQAASLKRITTA